MSQKSDLKDLVELKKSEILAKLDEISLAIDGLSELSSEELQKKIEELLLENSNLKADLEISNKLLAEVDLQAKKIDELIPDPV